MELLTRSKTLWGLFVLVIALTVTFGVWAPSIGGASLDTAITVEQSEKLLLKMSDDQKQSHFWMTLILDMVYPFVYGTLCIGVILKFAGANAKYLIIPVLLAVPSDVVENIIQLKILSGDIGLLQAKEITTSIKFLSLAISLMIVFGSIFKGVKQKKAIDE